MNEKITVEYINNSVENNYVEFVEQCENKYKSQIFEVVKKVKDSNGTIQFVMVAGPSSSGKTTTSKILVDVLKANGFFAKELSLDDFFVNRLNTPKWEDGTYNYETFESIDWNLFSNCMSSLLEGKSVKLPTYNFMSGEKEFYGETKLQENTVFIIEGLHALNPIIDNIIPKRKSFKIYISTNTTIKKDKQEYISNDTVRLFRRIIRDFHTRATTVEDTLKNWQRVKLGENLYIEPFVEQAEYFINTFHPYELCIYKTIFETFQNDCESLNEIKKVLEVFKNLDKTLVPKDSVIQEFIPKN